MVVLYGTEFWSELQRKADYQAGRENERGTRMPLPGFAIWRSLLPVLCLKVLQC